VNIDLSVKVMILYSVALTEADLGSPYWRLVYIGIIGIVTFLAFVWNPWKTSSERTKILKAATDQATCPECDSDEVHFDTLELMNPPVKVSCKRCGYEWWWTPPPVP